MTDVDAIPFPAGRTQNRPWAHRHGCRTCLDDALVQVGEDPRTGTDQMAPCPDCEAGFMVEFGYGRRQLTVGQSVKHVLYQGRARWGADGFWSRRGELRSAVQRPCPVAPALPVPPPDLLTAIGKGSG